MSYYYNAAQSTAASDEGVAAPRDVLSFWFGKEAMQAHLTLSSDEYVTDKMKHTWPALGFQAAMGSKDTQYEDGELTAEQCEDFLPSMQAAARMRLGWADEDDYSVMARIILLDQCFRMMSRGCHIYYPFLTQKLVEQCAEMARAEAMRFVDDVDKDDCIPLAFILFVVSPLMRSEDMDDHKAAYRFVRMPSHTKAYGHMQSFKQLVQTLQDHTAILKRFNRFPNLNKELGRRSSPAERAWLDDKENLPPWAYDSQTAAAPSKAPLAVNNSARSEDVYEPSSPKVMSPKASTKVTKKSAMSSKSTPALHTKKRACAKGRNARA